MPSYRKGRLNEQVTKEMAEIIRTVKDPRVSSSLVSITGADVSADLKTAKIYFSAIGDDAADVKKGLVSASGYIRTQLAQRLNLRVTPELHFFADESMARGAEMYELFKKVESELEENDDGGDGEE